MNYIRISLLQYFSMLRINKASKTDMRLHKEVRKIYLCVDCKYYQDRYCTHFSSINLVDGQEQHILAFDARDTTELCGPGAAYFKPINKQTRSKSITYPQNLQSHPPDLLLEN
jgi:hypothetical protein